jgi:single-stranded DNA-binding protein
VNHVQLSGIVAHRSDIQTLKSGEHVANLLIESTRKQRVDDIRVSVYGSLADEICTSIHAGQFVKVAGHLKHRHVPVAGGSQKMSTIYVVADSVVVADDDRGVS